MDAKSCVQGVARAARRAAVGIAAATTAQKNAVLERMAQNLRDSGDELKERNRLDFEAGREAGLSNAMLDLLELTDKLHARGPMALEELTTCKWTIIGSGQLRS